jgi:hypothetical protein
MTHEKFESEINTLKKFFEIYCHDKHQDRVMHEGNYNIPYKEKTFILNVTLCDECNSLLSSSIKHLQECPHEEKPRCRKCPTPCYSKEEWKSVAKIMKYAGIKLGLGKIGKRLKNLITTNKS